MFALYCPRHGHKVLLDVGRLTRLTNLEDGIILIEARCYDGERVVGVTGTGSVLPAEAVAGRRASAQDRGGWRRPARFSS